MGLREFRKWTPRETLKIMQNGFLGQVGDSLLVGSGEQCSGGTLATGVEVVKNSMALSRKHMD